MEEELFQKQKLAELYRQEEETRKEMEGEDIKENLAVEEEDSIWHLRRYRYDGFGKKQSQKEDPMVFPRVRDEQKLMPFRTSSQIDDLSRRNEQRCQNEKVVKQEIASQQEKQLHNGEERRKMIEYIKELKSRLMERNEIVDVRDRHARLAQEEEMRRKDLYTKDRLKLQTDFEEIDQYRAILAVRENEIQQKEISLKQLEEELQRKENDLKLKYTTQLRTAVKIYDETTEQITPEDRKETTNEPVVKTEVTHFVKPFVNGFSGADPIPENESSFEEWKLETQYLINSKVYPEYIINQAIRNSLRGQARKVLVTLGTRATSTEIRQKIEYLFGNVASWESVLQEFYNAMQKSNESVPAWGIRIEEIFQKAKEKGYVTDAQRDKMLKNKFWRGLKDTDLKNASRVHFEKEKVDFGLLRTKVRTIELEKTQDKSISKEEEKRELKADKTDKEEKDKGKDNSSKVEVQHQPAQKSSAKLLSDLLRKMESIEKRIDNIFRNSGRPFYRGRGRGSRGNPSPCANQVAPKDTKETKNSFKRVNVSIEGQIRDKRSSSESPNSNILEQIVGEGNESIININKFPISALVDSGSMISTCTEEFLEQLRPKPEILPLEDFELEIKVAGGYSLPYKDYTFVEVTVPFLSNEELNVPMLVVPQKSTCRSGDQHFKTVQ